VNTPRVRRTDVRRAGNAHHHVDAVLLPVDRCRVRVDPLATFKVLRRAMCLVLLVAPSAAVAQPPAVVEVATVTQRDVVREQSFTGTVTARRQSVIGSAADGRIVDFSVREGDPVKKGQPLAALRTGTLEIELLGARAELLLRQQELAELQHGSRPAELDRARAHAAAAEARKIYATAKLKRTQRLYEQRAGINQDELDQAQAAATAFSQEFKVATADLELMEEGPREERILQADARVAVQQEAVHLIEERIALQTIRAPFDGYVVKEHNEVGGWVNRGQPIVELVELDPIQVRVFVPETFIAFVRKSTPALVTVEALPGQEFTGQVVDIVPQADLRSRTFPVHVEMKNPETDAGHLLKSGMFARVTLTSSQTHQAIVVPKDALVLSGERREVYVVQNAQDGSGRTVHPVPVTLGVADDSFIEVRGGLEAGQQVVTKGNERLRPGQAVVVAE